MNPIDESTPSPETTPPNPPHARRRTGKVARLPRALRERINEMLDDGLPYAVILQKLGDDGKHLTINNLWTWSTGGYQDWLNAQAWADELRARRESFEALVRSEDGLLVPEGGLQLAALKISESIRDHFASAGADDSDLAELARLANSLARLSRTLIDFQKLRQEQAAAEVASRPVNSTPEITQREHDLITRKMDHFFCALPKPPPGNNTVPAPAPQKNQPAPNPADRDGAHPVPVFSPPEPSPAAPPSTVLPGESYARHST